MLNFYASSLTSPSPYLVPGCRVITGQMAANSANRAAKPALRPFGSPDDDPAMNRGDQYIYAKPTDLCSLEFFSWYIWTGIQLITPLSALMVQS